MKKFIAKVNGTEYVVELTEIDAGQSAVVQQTVAAPTPTPTPTPTPAPVAPAAPAAKPAVSAGAAGSKLVEAPMPGTILAVKVAIGDKVEKNQVVAVLEAMKMENDIVAPEDGTIASVNVSNGQSVDSGQLLVSMN